MNNLWNLPSFGVMTFTCVKVKSLELSVHFTFNNFLTFNNFSTVTLKTLQRSFRIIIFEIYIKVEIVGAELYVLLLITS